MGGAQGFTLGSLMKLTDTRGNKSRVTLLHYLVGRAEGEEGQGALAFVDDFGPDLNYLSR